MVLRLAILALALAALAAVTWNWQPVWPAVMTALGATVAAMVIFLARARTERQRRRTLEGLRALEPREFERAVAGWLERDGWRVEHRGGAGDAGIDLLAQAKDVVMAVQCKRYGANGMVTPAQVRELYGAAMAAGATRAVVVATTRIAPGAVTWRDGLEEGGPQLEFIDGTMVAEIARGERRIRPKG